MGPDQSAPERARVRGRPLPRELLEWILETGLRAPSSRNWHPWDFVLVRDREQLAVCSASRMTAMAAYLIDLGCPADRRLRPIRNPNRPAFEEVVRWSPW
jgi:Nitroreductase family